MNASALNVESYTVNHSLPNNEREPDNLRNSNCVCVFHFF